MAVAHGPSTSARYFGPKPHSLEIGRELSRGAYGSVHSGRMDGKEVAVKRLHRFLEAARGQGDLDTMLRDFRRESDLLERVDHPHVVGFKGAFYDETTDEPILVMELMTENLRQYLERKRGQLSRQKQLSICVEIVRGLRFLHTHTPPIVHRDLTDKNILLDADGMLKIGDLGQSRLKTADYFSTSVPGAFIFMPPEAMPGRSHYNEKVDMFSLGVLMLEIATQQPPHVNVFGIGTIPELQRREEDLFKLDDSHPLRPLILSCLKDNPKERPDIVTVHTRLLAMVEGVELQPVQSTASRPTQEVYSTTSGSEDPSQGGVFHPPTISGSEQPVLQTPPVPHSVQKGPHGYQQTQVCPQSGVLPPPVLNGPHFPVHQTPLTQSVEMGPVGSHQSQVFQTGPVLHGRANLQSEKVADLLFPASGATAITIGGHIYVCGGACVNVELARQVQVYNINNQTWGTFYRSPQFISQGSSINGQLVLIGGVEALSGTITNLVSTWTGQVWTQEVPRMPTKRLRPGVTTYGNFLVVAGGLAEDYQTLLCSIDMLNITTRQWLSSLNLTLPRPMYRMQVTISSAQLYVASGSSKYDAATEVDTTTNTVWQLPVTALENALTTEDDGTSHNWTQIAPTPYCNSALLQDTAHLVAVGGHNEPDKPTSDVFAYNPNTNEWSKVGQLGVPRAYCAVASLTRTSFIVCGGCTDARDQNTYLSSVEVVHV